MKYRVEQNTAVGHPPEQKWRVWMVDGHGDEWTMFFAPTRAKADKWAKRHRGRDVVHSRIRTRSVNSLLRRHLNIAVPVPGSSGVAAQFRAALEQAFTAGWKGAKRALRRGTKY